MDSSHGGKSDADRALETKEPTVYIGVGTIVVILLIIIIVMLMRPRV